MPKDGVTPTRLIGVQGLVVVQVHIELGVAAVRFRPARHAHGAALIGQAIARLVDHFGGRRYDVVVAIEAAALNHEVCDDAMKNRAGIVPLVDIFQEIRDGQGCPLGVQFEREASHGGDHLDLGLGGRFRGRGGGSGLGRTFGREAWGRAGGQNQSDEK